MQVTPLQQCEAAYLNVDCFNCDVASLATGSCMPGQYVYQYTLTDADGYSAVPVNVTVQIYEQVSASLPSVDLLSHQALPSMYHLSLSKVGPLWHYLQSVLSCMAVQEHADIHTQCVCVCVCVYVCTYVCASVPEFKHMYV